MVKIHFFLFGVEVSASTAQLHFINWILAFEQEHNPIALNAVNGQRCALSASRAFSLWVVPSLGVSFSEMQHIHTAMDTAGLRIVCD